MDHETFIRSSRRHFLAQQCLGVGSVALAWLLAQDELRAAPVKPTLEKPTFDVWPKPPRREAQATERRYLTHDATSVELYFQETFTFLTYTAEAAVVLA